MSNISPREAYELLKSGQAFLIDVREPDEFKAGHIPYALSMPLGQVGDAIAHLDIPLEKKILFQCLKGKRGENACALVTGRASCQNEVLNIEGGIEAWQAADLPVIGKASGLPIFRQIQIIIGFVLICLIVAGLTGAFFAFYIALLLSCAFFIAGVTGFCGLAYMLQKMPWNK